MDRYQKVEKPRPESVIKENEIRITSQGVVRNYVSYATSLLQAWIPLSRWILSFFGVISPISHRCRFYFLTLRDQWLISGVEEEEEGGVGEEVMVDMVDMTTTRVDMATIKEDMVAMATIKVDMVDTTMIKAEDTEEGVVVEGLVEEVMAVDEEGWEVAVPEGTSSNVLRLGLG
ncbi:hypothetical protein B296_00027219 [Ensete ventricosum]|uniref:Uncharacterized protein n=1 Tax=Ensete ventricosum TaxID=4639 RepID=A0A426ZE49_ENSVE|nr:hypothetical protein B296_00027219 [Ensete ventricosum]